MAKQESPKGRMSIEVESARGRQAFWRNQPCMVEILKDRWVKGVIIGPAPARSMVRYVDEKGNLQEDRYNNTAIYPVEPKKRKEI